MPAIVGLQPVVESGSSDVFQAGVQRVAQRVGDGVERPDPDTRPSGGDREAANGPEPDPEPGPEPDPNNHFQQLPKNRERERERKEVSGDARQPPIS